MRMSGRAKSLLTALSNLINNLVNGMLNSLVRQYLLRGVYKREVYGDTLHLGTLP